jgi:hypothetical protein
MSFWDVFNNIINVFPPIAAVLLLGAAGVVFIVGFSRHGMNFVKYGFKQSAVTDILEKLATKEDINRIDAKIDREINRLGAEIGGLRNELGVEIGGLRNEIKTMKLNHFGHLKNFLTELTSILLDKGVLNNHDKARLDNQLNGM